MGTTIADLTIEDVAKFCKIDDLDDVKTELKMSMASVETYIINRTGQTKEYIESQEDIAYAYLALINEQFENRQLRFNQGKYENNLIYSIIDAHRKNFLAYEDDEDG